MDKSTLKTEKIRLAEYYVDEYIEDINKNKAITKIDELLSEENKYKPIFDSKGIDQYDEPDVDMLNDIISDISTDLSCINLELVNSAVKVKELIDLSEMRIQNINQEIENEKERLNDIRMLCNDNNFTGVINLDKDDFITNAVESGRGFTCGVTSYNKERIVITDVSGNGYEGNKYVYKNGIPEKDIIDSSKRDYMVDNNKDTYYEYSRITTKNIEDSFIHSNMDNIKAECVVSIEAENDIYILKIESDKKDLVISQIETSSDGITYNDNLLEEIHFNNSSYKYKDFTYAYNTGLVSFPGARYIKITFRADESNKETIIYETENKVVEFFGEDGDEN